MNYVSVPDTDLLLSPVGLGTVKAGSGWEDSTAFRIFDAFTEYGGNVIDTARVYSRGESEAVLGRWFSGSGKRDRVILLTKGGHPKYDSPDDDLHIPRMTRADMAADLETSLKKLRTDHIDIYFYHRDDPQQPVEEEIETMEDFVRAGKIRYYGCSNWTAERILIADRYCRTHGYRGFVADEALLNLGMKYMKPLKDDTLVYLKDALYEYHGNTPGNLAVPYMGVANGFFHKYCAGGAEAVAGSPYCTEGNLAIAERCREMTDGYHATITQVVLGFFQCLPFAAVPLYGPNSPEQIPEIFETFSIPFKAGDFEAAMRRSSGDSGRFKKYPDEMKPDLSRTP